MKRHSFLVLLTLALFPHPGWADSDGAGCYGNGYLTYEKHLEDPLGLYVVFIGDGSISNPVRVTLPRSVGAYLFGIKCDSSKISIALRGEEHRTGNRVEIPIYVTEISLTDRTQPKIINDQKNHVQIWENYTNKKLESLGILGPRIVELPIPSINVKLSGKDIVLPSNDNRHEYRLVFLESETKSPDKEGLTHIFVRLKVQVIQRDLSGKVIQTAVITDHTVERDMGE
jgi:hypothetical protein